MLDAAALRRADPSGLHRVYDAWPEAAAAGRGACPGEVDFGGGHVVLAGMGGSGAVSDLLASLLSGSRMHVDVVKGYSLPRSAGRGTLVAAISVSGNTEETLSVLSQARSAGCRCVAFSDGGRMAEYCKRRGVEHRRVPMEHSPRASFAAFAYAALAALRPVVGVADSDVAESLSRLEAMRGRVGSASLGGGNPALSLAEWLPERPVIYYPRGLRAPAVRFKNALQENAKMHASAEDVIEACHNGIVPWAGRPGRGPVLVRGPGDHPGTRGRWEVLKEFLGSEGVEYREVLPVRGCLLSRLVCLVYLFDCASVYRAALSGTDPTPIRAIDFVKARAGR